MYKALRSVSYLIYRDIELFYDIFLYIQILMSIRMTSLRVLMLHVSWLLR